MLPALEQTTGNDLGLIFRNQHAGSYGGSFIKPFQKVAPHLFSKHDKFVPTFLQPDASF